MIGLDNAGKSTILYKLKVNEVVSTLPTIGFNCEAVDYKGLCFNMWDVGGQDKIRVLWKHYYQNSDAIIYVVDSVDNTRFSLASEELFKTLSEEELVGVPVLVFANKQDISQAENPNNIVKEMELGNIKGHKWLLQGCSATTGQGLADGLDWLAKELNK